jgi:hypothetical protein
MYENRRPRTANPAITARHELNHRLAVHRRHLAELQPYVALARLEPREEEKATLRERIRSAHSDFLRETEGLDDVDGLLTDLRRSFARIEQQVRPEPSRTRPVAGSRTPGENCGGDPGAI